MSQSWRRCWVSTAAANLWPTAPTSAQIHGYTAHPRAAAIQRPGGCYSRTEGAPGRQHAIRGLTRGRSHGPAAHGPAGRRVEGRGTAAGRQGFSGRPAGGAASAPPAAPLAPIPPACQPAGPWRCAASCQSPGPWRGRARWRCQNATPPAEGSTPAGRGSRTPPGPVASLRPLPHLTNSPTPPPAPATAHRMPGTAAQRRPRRD